MQALSDEDLMAHAQAGHHDALAVIVTRYQRLVWGLAAKIVHDAGEAELFREGRELASTVMRLPIPQCNLHFRHFHC
jgi:hypothetical protein